MIMFYFMGMCINILTSISRYLMLGVENCYQSQMPYRTSNELVMSRENKGIIKQTLLANRGGLQRAETCIQGFRDARGKLVIAMKKPNISRNFPFNGTPTVID
jgi:hypothetical protein